MRRAILAAVVALSPIGVARGDDAQVFHLRGECHNLAQSFFDKLEKSADSNCIENFFKGSNYNVKDNRCYIEIETLQDKVVSSSINETNKATWCQRIIDQGIMCMDKLLYDAQTEELKASASSGICDFNRDRNAYEYRGFLPDSEKVSTFLGYRLSLTSEYTQALDFIKSKMEENYKD